MAQHPAMRTALVSSVALGLMLFGVLGSRPNDSPLTVGSHEQAKATSELSSVEGVPVAETTEPSRVAETQEIIGRLVWSDGAPVAGAEVAFVKATPSTVSDADGIFRLEGQSVHTTGVALLVRPRCWITPSLLTPMLKRQLAGPNQVSDYVVPAEMDVQLNLSVDEVSKALLQRAGYDAVEGELFTRDRQRTGVRDEISAFFEQRTVLASVTLPIDRLPASRVLRISIGEAVEGRASLAPPSGREALGTISTATVHLASDRRFSPELDLSLEARGLIAGRVVDQEGHPLAACKVAVPRLEPNGLGPRRVTTDDNGWFMASGAPGDTHVVWASYEGVKSERLEVPVGTTDLELRCSTAGLRRIVVRSGSEPLQRFTLTTNSSLFGKYRFPWLPLHRDGVALLPFQQQPEPRYLCWSDGTTYHEVPLMIPGVQDAPMFEIDTSQLTPEPRGVLLVEHVPGGPGISLRRVHPMPPQGFAPAGCGAPSWKDAPLLGILGGTYEIRIGTDPARPVATVRVDLVAGENRIRVADLLRQR